MKIKNLVLMAALSLAALSAQALNVVNTIALAGDAQTGYTAGLSDPSGTDVYHLRSGAFTDQFTFRFTGDAVFDVSLVTSAAQDELAAQQIFFTSADVNGIAVQMMNARVVFGTVLRSASLLQAGTNGDLILTVHGYAGLLGSTGADIAASYSGTINVSAVPEPETYALMLGGLALIGFVARRRKAV